jgi:hypothetical protein
MNITIKHWRTKLGAAITLIGGAYGKIFPAHVDIGLLIIAIGTAITGLFSVDAVQRDAENKGPVAPPAVPKI